MKKYRYEAYSNKLFEYVAAAHAYLFVRSCPDCKTKKQAVEWHNRCIEATEIDNTCLEHLGSD